jgi:hypothetical protein
MGEKDDDIGSVRHSPDFDTESINRAVESASKDETFIDKAMNLVKGLSYPALKKDIVDYAKHDSSLSRRELVALFESLNGYIEYKDMYHLRRALEENNSEKKKSNQITQPAREQPTQPSRSASLDNVTNKNEMRYQREERSDYSQVPPSAMTNFICNNCGKQFQNQNDLVQHQRVEGSKSADKNNAAGI